MTLIKKVAYFYINSGQDNLMWKVLKYLTNSKSAELNGYYFQHKFCTKSIPKNTRENFYCIVWRLTKCNYTQCPQKFNEKIENINPLGLAKWILHILVENPLF